MNLILKFCCKKGFTLIELIMTIIVVGIIAIPLSMLITEHFASTLNSSEHTMTMHLARFEMEKVNNMDYASISNASISNYEGYSYDITRTVTFVQGDASSPESLKQVTVDVTQAGGSTVLFSLVTYVAKNMAYGI